jgi:hypothetical protein
MAAGIATTASAATADASATPAGCFCVHAAHTQSFAVQPSDWSWSVPDSTREYSTPGAAQTPPWVISNGGVPVAAAPADAPSW